jgi:hypothetical protein
LKHTNYDGGKDRKECFNMKNTKSLLGLATLWLTIIAFALTGCPDPNDPTVTNVTVSPARTSLAKGSTADFTARVSGTDNPVQTVTWSVDGGKTGTIITSSGILAVAADETAATLIVTATSTVDTTKSGSAIVTITDKSTIVTAVTVSPDRASLASGATIAFTATVTGTGNPAQTVTWSVDGGSAGTSISAATGILTVAANESAATLTVTASSTADTTKRGTAVVTVTDTRVTLGAGIAVSVEGAATTASVSFTRAMDLTLTASDFVVDNGATVTGVSLIADTAAVNVNFPANLSSSPKTYTVSIAVGSTKIKGNATVAITQAATGPEWVVNALDLTALVRAPVKGNAPGTMPINETQYTGSIAWYTSVGEALNGQVFADATVYDALVTLNAKPGYTFTGVLANSFTYTGATMVRNGTDSGTVLVSFPATANETGGVTVNFGGLPQDETIGLTGSTATLWWTANTPMTVIVNGTFSAYEWYVDGVLLALQGGNSVTLTAQDYSLGRHTISVNVRTTGGAYYSKTAHFTVVL